MYLKVILKEVPTPVVSTLRVPILAIFKAKPNNSKNLNTNLLAQKLIDILYKYKK